MTNSRKQKKILVTTALPYANGPLHLGHLVEHIQTDIWVRVQKMLGRDCIAICGEDAHGTAIMIKAEERSITPEALISAMKQAHEQDFKDFYIHHDNYYTTHSEENYELACQIYRRLKAQDDIIVREIKQLFDPEKQIFLPDRYIKGECPACGSEDQYGDNCDNCGATYQATDLKNPRSAISGATPIEKKSNHYFFKLTNYENFLKKWSRAGHLQKNVINKLDEWLKTGLQDWDISRDSPYFGFEIPDAPGKYFYVWLDAPIGYMASFKNLCQKKSALNFDEYWQKDSTTELYHFVGKDIVYFHALFWPAMLEGTGYRTPTEIFAHGYLTVDGQKMSKSRGTFIKARTYLDHLNPEYLRYYYAAKLSNHIEDIDLNFDDFMVRVNADLIGKVVNIASRCARFVDKHFTNRLASECTEPELYQTFVDAGEKVATLYKNRDYSHAIRQIMLLADKANQYIDQHKPWQLIKDTAQTSKVQNICTVGLNLFRVIMIYLKPVLPQLASEVEHFLKIPPMDWEARKAPLLNHEINPFKPLLKRIGKEQIEQMKKSALKGSSYSDPISDPMQINPQNDKNVKIEQAAAQTVDITTFNKIDLRVAKIISAEYVEGSKKLLKLQLDLGKETRQVFAGLKGTYAPEDIVGKLTVVVANLKPRKMRFGVSEGMVLAAGSGGDELWLISPEQGAQPGMPVS